METKNNHLDFYIIDAIGPFFKKQKRTVNWSKIPFFALDKKGEIKAKRIEKILKRFRRFVSKCSELGYNAISLDDLAHLVTFDFYPARLQKKLSIYKSLYSKLFDLAIKEGLYIYINTDIMFFNQAISDYTRNRESNIIALLSKALEQLFCNYPVKGVVFRIGENDGIDVKGDFISRLSIKTPRQANRYLKQLLPIFEMRDKFLIFRTWTVGIHKIGDLMFNPVTFAKTFSQIESEHLIVSMKYGDTDFFDQLDLNPLIMNCPHKFILELQTRREREGFGELPYYVGWQYERYFRQLAGTINFTGISVWCQTGGWSKWQNLTFIKRSSPWNELNTTAAIEIFKNGSSADSVLHALYNKQITDFITLCHETFTNIIYIKNLSVMTLYLRRLRLPPLLWIYWDHVIINPLVMALYNFVGHQEFSVPRDELKKIKKMGKKLNISNIDFIYDTLLILAKCHRAITQKYINTKLIHEIAKYEKKYPNGLVFSVRTSQQNFGYTRTLFKLFLRKQAKYRPLDYVLLSPPASYLIRLLVKSLTKHMPGFVNKQAMPIEELFK
ncbi:glycosyl hydrolase family 67 [candidate division KSB1 bacterium]|nr:glycosyl hydrolase family 67 [candidate division KSB1 bacterium]